MKFEIDTETKTITLIGELRICDLDKLKKFVGKDWEKWSIKGTTTCVGTTTWIPYVHSPIYPSYPINPIWYGTHGHTVLCSTGTSSNSITCGSNIAMGTGTSININTSTPLFPNNQYAASDFNTIGRTDTLDTTETIAPTKFLIDIKEGDKDFGFKLTDLIEN